MGPDPRSIIGETTGASNNVAGLPTGYVRVIDEAGNVVIVGPNGETYRNVAAAQRAAVGVNTSGGRPIEFDGQFYSADGIKFSKSYYEYLYKNGRPAPFLQARAVLDSNPKIMPDPQGAVGYFRYEGAGLEMIYNPATGQVGHIQPIR